MTTIPTTPPPDEPPPPAGLPADLPGSSTPSLARRGSAFALMALFGGALLGTGTFMPWLVMSRGFSTRTVSALDLGGDSVIFLGCGAAAICIGAARLLSPVPPIIQRLPSVTGALAVILVAIDASRPATWGVNPDPNILSADRGAGVYMLMLGAVITAIGGLGVTPTAASETAGGSARIKLAVAGLAAGVLGGLVHVSGILYTVAIALALLAVLFGVEALIGARGRSHPSVTVWGLVLVSAVVAVGTLVAAVPALNDAKVAKYWVDEHGQQHRYWMDSKGNRYY